MRSCPSADFSASASAIHDTRQGGYVVGLTRQQLEGAPTFARTETPAWGDRAYEKSIHDYYGAAPYWGR